MPISATALWISSTFADFDLAITTAIHSLYNVAGVFFTPFLEFFSFVCAPIPITLIGLALAFFKKTRHFGLAFLLGISVGAILTNGCLKLLVARPRPYADESSLYYQFWLLVGQHVEPDNSFPSGHTTAAFAAAMAIFFRCDKRFSWIAFIGAFTVAVSRIYLAVHFPSDVLVGVIVGIISGCIGTLIAVKAPKICYDIDFLHMKKGKHEKKQTGESW